MADRPANDRGSTVRSVALASGFGCSVIALLVLFVGGGLLLDRHYASTPLWTLVGVAVGLIAIVAEFAFLVRSSRRESAASPGRRAVRPRTINPEWDDEDWPSERSDQTRGRGDPTT